MPNYSLKLNRYDGERCFHTESRAVPWIGIYPHMPLPFCTKRSLSLRNWAIATLFICFHGVHYSAGAVLLRQRVNPPGESPPEDPLRGALPYLREPQDTLRQGLPNLKEETKIAHPVETIQDQGAKERQAKEYDTLKNLYGAAFPAKMQIEREILGRFGRLPGLPSSRLGLQALTGELDELSFDSYLGLPEHSERPETDLHTQMEAKLNMALNRP